MRTNPCNPSEVAAPSRGGGKGVGVAHATPVLENYFFILTEVDSVLIGTQTTPFFTQTKKKKKAI